MDTIIRQWGVTYKISKDMPEKLKKVFPDVNELKKLLDSDGE